MLLTPNIVNADNAWLEPIGGLNYRHTPLAGIAGGTIAVTPAQSARHSTDHRPADGLAGLSKGTR